MATPPTTTVLLSHLAVASRLQGRDLVSSLAAPSLSSVRFLPRYLPVACYLACYYPPLATRTRGLPISAKQRDATWWANTSQMCGSTSDGGEDQNSWGILLTLVFTHSPNPPIHPSLHSSLPHLSFRACARSTWYHRACNEDAGTKRRKDGKLKVR